MSSSKTTEQTGLVSGALYRASHGELRAGHEYVIPWRLRAGAPVRGRVVGFDESRRNAVYALVSVGGSTFRVNARRLIENLQAK